MISATGLNNGDFNEITVGTNTIIDETGVQVYHPYNILLPTVPSGYWNVHDELESLSTNITAHDIEFLALSNSLSSTDGKATSALAIGTAAQATATAAGGTATNALALAGQKNNIITWSNPFNYNSDTLTLKYDSSLTLDPSGNLKVVSFASPSFTSNQILIGNGSSAVYQTPNLYFDISTNRLGIGKTNPTYSLDVLNNINCNELYRNGISLSSTLSNFLPLSGGTLTGILTGTTISTTNLSSSGITTATLSTTGNVGIGLTNPASKLDILATGIQGAKILSDATYILTLGHPNLTQSLSFMYFGIYATGTNTNQDIGFGSKNNGALNFNTNGSNRVMINDNGTNRLRLNNGTNLSMYTGSQLQIDSASVVGGAFLVNASGNVGIANTTPAEKLDVSGNIKASGTINAITNLQENSVNLIDKYTSLTFLRSNTTRKFGFNFTTLTSLTLNGTTYYKYDINLNNYTTNLTFNAYTQLRQFKIKTWLTTSYFDLTNLYCLDYEVSMSDKSAGGTNGAHAGLNLLAYGYPYENFYFDKIIPSGQFLLRNDFNYLTYISSVYNTAVSCLIIDYL